MSFDTSEQFQFTLQVSQALTAAQWAGRNTPGSDSRSSSKRSSGIAGTPRGGKSSSGHRAARVIKSIAPRRGAGRLPFMRHTQGGLSGKSRLGGSQLLPRVCEDIRHDGKELESMIDDEEEMDDYPRVQKQVSTRSNRNRQAYDSNSSVGSDTSQSSISIAGSQAGLSYCPSGSSLPSASSTRPGSASGLRDKIKNNEPDSNLPFQPFCKKCAPIRPTDCLCLRPEGCSMAMKKMERNKQSYSVFNNVDPKDVVSRANRRGSFGFGGSRAKGAGDTPQKWIKVLHMLNMSTESTVSAFEGCGVADDEREASLCTDPQRPPVMHKLTLWEICLLECWAIQHVKSQYLEKCVIAHAETPLKKNRHRDNMHSSTICQLVRKASKNQLDEVEKAFMIAKLRHYPLLKDLPGTLLEDHADLLDVRTFSRGATIFERGDPIDGIYILVQGDAELSEGAMDSLGDSGSVKTAPSVILLEDAVIPHPSRPFLLQPTDKRFRSRTVTAWDDDDANTTAMTLWLPFRVIVKSANFWRKREAHDRIDLIVKQFAPALRLDKGACEKHCAIFELESYTKQHAVLQQGGKSSMSRQSLA